MGEEGRTDPLENIIKALDPSLEENTYTKSFGRRLRTACSPAVHPFQTHSAVISFSVLRPKVCKREGSRHSGRLISMRDSEENFDIK